jgi:AcrR family transcriptional regulator
MATVNPSTGGARERARRDVLGQIEREAWRQLTETGPGELSLRSVARALGMANSALYRYFPSRDHLLRTLLGGADASLARTLRAALADAPPPTRWRALAHAARGWARSHPHELALVDFALPDEARLAAEAAASPSGFSTGSRRSDIPGQLGVPALLGEVVGPERSLLAWVLLLALLRLDRLDRAGLPGCAGELFEQGVAATEQLLSSPDPTP